MVENPNGTFHKKVSIRNLLIIIKRLGAEDGLTGDDHWPHPAKSIEP